MTDTKKLWLTGLAVASGLAGFFLLWSWLYDRSHHSWLMWAIFWMAMNVGGWFFWRRASLRDNKVKWRDPGELDENERLITFFPRDSNK